MEQKYQAVLAVIRDGVSIVEVANHFGVPRQSVHSWLARYEAEGMAGLAERSHRPQRCEHQMSSEVEVRVIELRRQNLFWTPRCAPKSGEEPIKTGERPKHTYLVSTSTSKT